MWNVSNDGERRECPGDAKLEIVMKIVFAEIGCDWTFVMQIGDDADEQQAARDTVAVLNGGLEAIDVTARVIIEE